MNNLKNEFLKFLQALGFDETDDKKGDNAISFFIKLIGSVFLIFIGLFFCLLFPLSGLMFILTGIIICPPIWYFFNKYLKLKPFFQYIFSGVFFLLVFFFIPISTIPTEERPNVATIETPKPMPTDNISETISPDKKDESDKNQTQTPEILATPTVTPTIEPTPETSPNPEPEQTMQAEQERAAQEQAAAQAEQERIAKEQAAAQAEQERIAKEQAAQAEQERIAKEQAAAQAEQERIAQEQAAAQAEQERIAREQAAAIESSVSNENSVWIPKSGKKYHSNPNCSGMKNPSQVSLSEAQSRGYEPCSKCY